MRMPRLHPRMLRHTYVTTMLDVGVDLRDVQIAACRRSLGCAGGAFASASAVPTI